MYKTQAMNLISLNYINEFSTRTVAVELQKLLSNYQTFTTTIRYSCGKIKEDGIYKLHDKLKEVYYKAEKRIQEIEERITMLGEDVATDNDDSLLKPLLRRTNISDDDHQYIELIVQNLNKLINIERNIISTAIENGDPGTVALMSNFILDQEKDIWKFTTYLTWTRRISLS